MCQVLCYTMLLAIAMVATGWALGELTHITCLRGRRLEKWLGRAFLGTGVWILVFGLCSHLGGSVRSLRLPLVLGMFALVGVATIICRRRWKLRLPHNSTLIFLFASVLA